LRAIRKCRAPLTAAARAEIVFIEHHNGVDRTLCQGAAEFGRGAKRHAGREADGTREAGQDEPSDSEEVAENGEWPEPAGRTPKSWGNFGI